MDSVSRNSDLPPYVRENLSALYAVPINSPFIDCDTYKPDVYPGLTWGHATGSPPEVAPHVSCLRPHLISTDQKSLWNELFCFGPQLKKAPISKEGYLWIARQCPACLSYLHTGKLPDAENQQAQQEEKTPTPGDLVNTPPPLEEPAFICSTKALQAIRWLFKESRTPIADARTEIAESVTGTPETQEATAYDTSRYAIHLDPLIYIPDDVINDEEADHLPCLNWLVLCIRLRNYFYSNNRPKGKKKCTAQEVYARPRVRLKIGVGCDPPPATSRRVELHDESRDGEEDSVAVGRLPRGRPPE